MSEAASEARRRQEAADYDEGLRRILAGRPGRTVLRRWLSELGLFHAALSGEDQVIRSEGRREGALLIWDECRRVDSAGLARLLQEELEQNGCYRSGAGAG